ncbi:ATP-binding cassette domain-containing protein [Gemella sp. GH3]|uniref:ABC transporter ATP-binding protein/permease n=1 Tax=unclassified Gemella TaxID=2624949 RepID=UPI0015CF937C|nr:MULTISPECIES: ATP-binding cassette domain-containing protein [unclassified Gemella]MBF0714643.1 ATP-binding cassette domain-containing protein [Gemella sp. GH3.1]NYS51595.1 ATP-binding cassette domain-containing protein [Gemella sp. GH3]
MKLDKRSLASFNIKNEVYLIAFCKILIFLCTLYSTYNFIDLLFAVINDNINNYFIFTFLTKLIITTIIYYTALYFDNKFSHKISKQVRNSLRREIFNKIEKLSLNYTEAISTSNLIVANSSSIISIELYFNKFIPQIFATMFIAITSVIIFGSINFWLALAMLILYPFIPLSIMIIIKKSKKSNKKNFSDFLSLADLFFDRLNGFNVAKIYGKESNISQEIDETSSTYRKSTMELLKHQLNSINVMDAITYISIFIMSVIGIMTLSNFMLVIFILVASFECFRPMRTLGGLFHISMKATIELDNIYKLLDYPEVKKDNNINVNNKGSLTFKDVDYSYDKQKNILQNINLQIKNSQKIAFVGESGSGKSTLIKLIMGLIKSDTGDVVYNDVPTYKIPFPKLMNLMTVITSESYLSEGTIRQHLSITPDISENDMLMALEKVNLKDFVLSNGGLDYKVEIGGTNLSGGQRQRLLAAKAILKDSYIYILDEAVSNIDDYSKKCVLDAFDSIKDNKIIILISHDLETLQNCDKIFVINNGEIIESGKHIELKNKKGLYSELLSKQKNLKNKFFNKEVRYDIS